MTICRLIKYVTMGDDEGEGIRRDNVILKEVLPDGQMKFEKVFLYLMVSKLRLK